MTATVTSQGPGRLVQRQRATLADIVAYARAYSPYYRELYRAVPDRVEEATLLPVTQKKTLMERFDEWATDRAVTLDKARAFTGNPALIGEWFLGKYLLATTSGTTGTPGIFVLDDRHLKAGATGMRRAFLEWLTLRDFLAILVRGMRIGAVHATGGHFASVVGMTRLRRSSRLFARKLQDFPVQRPLPELVAALNRFRPAVLIGYATVVALLAREREAGRLRINPRLVVVTAEGSADDDYERIAKVFRAKVGNVWGSTEIAGVAYNCTDGWLHVTVDLAIIEPVEADYRPTPPGKPSHTVLVTNLANRVQPILRYDLGDSVLQRPDPCPCGNPLPAIRVEGRAADMLTIATLDADSVTIPPLAFDVDDVPGVALVQIVQTAATTLRVRLRLTAGANADRVWEAVNARTRRVLGERGLDHVRVERASEPPEQSPGGKYRAVIPSH